MSEARGPIPPERAGAESEAVLRAKYLDYCSSQVAEFLLRLTPDETYVLAQEAAVAAGSPAEPSYLRMVELATGHASRRLQLPPFELWAQAYREDPDRYEPFFLGLWESELEPSEDNR